MEVELEYLNVWINSIIIWACKRWRWGRLQQLKAAAYDYLTWGVAKVWDGKSNILILLQNHPTRIPWMAENVIPKTNITVHLHGGEFTFVNRGVKYHSRGFTSA